MVVRRVWTIRQNVVRLKSLARKGPKTGTSRLTITHTIADIRQETTEVSVDCIILIEVNLTVIQQRRQIYR